MVRNRMSGCFASARTLRNKNPSVLCDFLELFPGFLKKAKIGLPADRDPEKIPYDDLFDALMSDKVPNHMTVQLVLINKLANETGWQEILHEAGLRGVEIPAGIDHLCDTARAMRVWTVAQPDHPDLLEESFARARIYKKSSYTYYSMSTNIMERFSEPGDAALKKLEADLNVHFRVSEGTKVLKYDFENEIWFLVRHPGIVKWQGVYEKGRVTSRAVTPELYDAVVYHKKYGDLRMNTHRMSDHKCYRIEFGHLLFNTANVFDPHRKVIRLRPLWGDAEELCRTGDIQGLEEMRICEVRFYAMQSHNRRLVTWSSEQENENLPLFPSNRVIPDDADSVLHAKFRYRLKSSDRWQGLTVYEGKTLSYERDGDSCVLEEWLRERTIINAAST